ncbi:MAG: tetratricopeptide repeat protein [bacterium]
MTSPLCHSGFGDSRIPESTATVLLAGGAVTAAGTTDAFSDRILKPFSKVVFLLWLTFCGLFIQSDLYGQTQGRTNNRIRMAQDFERRGRYDAALRIYRNLYDQVPKNQLYYEGVKRNMLRLEMFDPLIELINVQIQRSSDPRYYADLGNVFYKYGQHDKAIELWKNLLQRYPHNKAVYPYVANAMISNRLYDEAIEIYLSARRNLKRNDIYVFEVANLYVIRLNYREATLEYLNYLEKYPNQFNYIEGRIASYTKEAESAHKVAELLQAQLEKTKQEYWVRKLLADLYLRIEEYGKSFQHFQILGTLRNPASAQKRATGKEIYFFAEKALAAGEFKFAQHGYDMILTHYSKSPYRIKALFGVATAKQQQGFSDEAIQSFRSLISQAPKSPLAEQAQFQIGEIYLKDLFELEKALHAYQVSREKYPNGRKIFDTYFRIGDCLVAQGRLSEAKKWYGKPLVTNQKSREIVDRALYNKAFVDFMSGDYDRALKSLNKITEDVGSKTPADQNYVNDAFELIFLIEDNIKTSKEALAEYSGAQKLRRQREYTGAVNRLQRILSDFPNAGVVDESLLALGEIENIRENYAAAVQYFEALVTEHSGSVYAALAQKRIGEVYENGLGDVQKASQAYERVLIDYPRSLYLEAVRQKLRNLQSRQLNN